MPKLIQQEQVNMIKEAYYKYRFSTSLLEPIIKMDYWVNIPNNRIHRVLLNEWLAKKLGKEIEKKIKNPNHPRGGGI